MQTMVQDDEYVTISSANLNQRSLDGSRDTEMGMGSWQPSYTLANAKSSQDGGGTAASNTTSIHLATATGHNNGTSAASATGYTSSDRGFANGSRGSGGDADGGGDGNSGSSKAQVFSDDRQAGQGFQHSDDTSGQNGGGGPQYREGQANQWGQDRSQSEPGGSHVSGHVAPGGGVMAQPPSESWGQAGGGMTQPQSELGGSRMQQGQRGELKGDQDRAAGGLTGVRVDGSDGQQSSQEQGQGQNEGWGQAERQPQQQGQKQGSGPGQSQGQGQNQEGDSEPHVAFPKGEVYGYRMALWLEHLGGKHDPVYDQPHSLACVKRVNYLAEQNWLQFSGEEDCDMTGHLITFPIIVDRSGAVSARTVNGQFSDIDNSIKGKKMPIPAIFLN